MLGRDGFASRLIAIHLAHKWCTQLEYNVISMYTPNTYYPQRGHEMRIFIVKHDSSNYGINTNINLGEHSSHKN